MTPEALPAAIARVHAAYCLASGLKERLAWCENLWKPIVQDYGYDIDRLCVDVVHACRYIRRGIADGKRNEGALVSRNFLRLETFTEEVARAQAFAKSAAPAPAKPAAPKPTPPKATEDDWERMARLSREAMSKLNQDGRMA